MKLLFATRNAGKQREARRILEAAGHQVVFPDDAGVPESADEASLEITDSLETNARKKAEYFIRKTGLPTVADDSGLEVFSLGGAPGARSKRWAGVTGDARTVDAANNAELLRRLHGAPVSRRHARFRCVLVYIKSAGAIPLMFTGMTTGRIIDTPKGEGGFGYDPYFWSDELGRTLAEISGPQKDAISHRGRAIKELLLALAGT